MTENYLTKLRISKNVQYNEILLEVSNNTMNKKEYFSTMKHWQVFHGTEEIYSSSRFN